MTPQEIIAEARIPGTNSVLVLGSFEKRVTVYSQQVRALNLVDAILSENLVRPNGGKVAIVGGGAAGITAAVALARTSPNLERLDLFERNSAVLSLQHGSRRFLHPHFYDWPAADSDRNDAGLPLMNWTAGAAGDVAATLRAEFDAECHKTILTLYNDQAVTGLIPSSLGPIRVVVDKSTAIGRIYDVVILAIGFGLEAYLDGETLSYWSPSALAGPIHTQVANPILFISGNGDGGLVDFTMAAFNALEHHQICAMLMGLDLGAARAEIEAIEQEAWAPGATVDLLAEYRARLRPLVPLAVWQEIAGQLRPAMLIHFHTRDAQLLRRTTALHNRLAVYLILEADLELGRNAITVTTNAEFDGPIPKRGEVRIVGQDAIDPLRRFLRLGPDAASNLKPFQDLLDHYPGAINAPRSATRPESPTLTASAHARFTALQLAPPPAPAVTPVAAAPAVNAIALTLSLAAPGHVAWSGNLDPGTIGQVWSTNRTLALYCDIPTVEIGVLAPVIARLGAHATGFMLHTTHNGWRTTLGALCAGKALPGPDLDIRCPVSDLQIAPAPGQMTQHSIATLAATIDGQLDGEVLRQLHVALHEILGPAAAQIGWPIEPALRAKLWDLWQQWYVALAADSAKCRRYLRLLVSEKDREIPDEAALVGIGPKTVRPFMTKSTIFALAFAACSGLVLSPAAQRPGNIASEALTAHSCGISWINERMLGTRAAMEQGWTTGVVLLSQLREAALMMEGDLRMDRNISDAASVGRISPAEDPLVIGADDVFITALEAGETTMREYLRSIFEWRSRAAAQALEEVNDDAA
ncbi:hypothetical protein CO657_22905 (plasmid) [Rhizobium acidisoli]|uniref:ABC-three component systems C-terminal domain-containing protein n=1 Tax=Rhizobium acidisoli TaxID=1538158 RepID=A0AAE5WPI5_9HYPH|nr:hypothetical protein AOG23_33470 [Rhizobium acidisoli]QAS80885.1 hypothetical protein CO657_22905 [Rhizobium acidisoli]